MSSSSRKSSPNASSSREKQRTKRKYNDMHLLSTYIGTNVPRRGHKTSTYYQKYLLSGLVYVHEAYTETE